MSLPLRRRRPASTRNASSRRAPRSLALVATVALFPSLSSAVLAADVTGSVTVPANAPSPGARPEATGPRGYWEEWNGFLDPRPPRFDPRRDLTVVLAGAPAARPRGCSYALAGGDLAPRTLVVQAGATFRIENRGAAAHELHAPGVPELAPLQTAPGSARTASIPRPGTHRVADRLFPHVRGHLVVVEDLVACGEVAADGSYRFNDVMPGTYTLRVYHRGEVVAEKAAEVGARNLTIDAITPELPASP
jgi:hypothetical protein